MKRMLIILLMPLLLGYGRAMAQDTVVPNLDKKPEKVEKGKSCISGMFDFATSNQLFSSKSYLGVESCADFWYAYFFAKRYALFSGFGYKGSAYSSYSGGNLDAHISAKVRRYFFAKANCFVGLGVQAGRYFSVENSSPSDVFFYCMPDIEIGYEYLLTDVHPALDNHLALEVCASTLIPYKQRYWSTALPCFPALKLQVGISYHL